MVVIANNENDIIPHEWFVEPLEQHGQNNIVKLKLPAREKENIKTNEQKNDDWAFVLSHMFTCLATDFAPVIANYIQKQNTGENNLLQHLGGEIIGDLAAVPATVAVQRLSPEVTDLIRKTSEPLFKPFYEFSANNSAKKWAENNDIKLYSKEFNDYKEQKYEDAMSKLPLQVIWTVLSVAINVGVQKNPLSKNVDVLNELFYNNGSVPEVAMPVMQCALGTMALQSVGRIAIPDLMQWFDDVSSKYLVEPVTKIFAGNKEQASPKIDGTIDNNYNLTTVLA